MNDAPAMRFFITGSRWKLLDWRDLWLSRRLAWALAMRDFNVRYRQTAIGMLWAIIQPLLTMIVFATIIGWMREGAPTSGAPYFLAIFCTLIPWFLFANSIRDGTVALVANRDLLTKLYFPRIILPLSTIIVNLIDLIFALVVFALLLLFSQTLPSTLILAFPLVLLVECLLIIGCTLWLSALNALYGDVSFITPFFVQLGMFISPVLYDASVVVPESSQFLYSLNPMVGILQASRWCVFGMGEPPVWSFLWSILYSLCLVITGLYYFRRVESVLTDVI